MGEFLRIDLFLFASSVCLVQGYQSSGWIHPFLPKFMFRKELHLPKQKEDRFRLVGSEDFPKLSQSWKTFYSSDIRENLTQSNKECEVEIVNNFSEPVVFCWVSDSGQLKHHYIINDNSIKDNSVSNRHYEYTQIGHSFVCFQRTADSPKTLKDIPSDLFIFHFTPKIGQSKFSIELNQKVLKYFLRRGRTSRSLKCSCEPLVADEILDTSSKIYDDLNVHGFRLKCEQRVFDDTSSLKESLEEDLLMIEDLLPSNACALLKSHVPIYINKSLTYGTKNKPIVGNSMCFHPVGGRNWLEKHGLSVEKEGCVEIASADDYLQCRILWGKGGVLLHELSHAFHNHFCDGGYDNLEIQQAYETAMKKQLYQSVSVHGKQGLNGLAKAYACTNCMEFFAELSVAFHYTKDNDYEFNKWFPFNRYQLVNYDRETFLILEKLWNQHENGSS
jgi:hypothetical protein